MSSDGGRGQYVALERAKRVDGALGALLTRLEVSHDNPRVAQCVFDQSVKLLIVEMSTNWLGWNQIVRDFVAKVPVSYPRRWPRTGLQKQLIDGSMR